MLNTPFSPWPSFTEEEADAVRAVILSNKVNYWTGQETRSFEKEFAAWSGTEYAVALANGTVALDVALLLVPSWLRFQALLMLGLCRYLQMSTLTRRTSLLKPLVQC